MAIRFRLKELLEARGMSQTDLQHQSKLAYSTISELFHNKARRIDVGTLEAICNVLDCTVGDVIEYLPPKKRARS